MRGGFASGEASKNIQESRAARLAGNRDHCRSLSRGATVLLRIVKHRYGRSHTEDAEGHLNGNDFRPVC